MTITARPDTAEDGYFTRGTFFCTTRGGRLEPDQTGLIGRGSDQLRRVGCVSILEAPRPQRPIAPLRAQRRGRRSPCHIASRNTSNRRAGPIGLPGCFHRATVPVVALLRGAPHEATPKGARPHHERPMSCRAASRRCSTNSRSSCSRSAGGAATRAPSRSR